MIDYLMVLLLLAGAGLFAFVLLIVGFVGALIVGRMAVSVLNAPAHSLRGDMAQADSLGAELELGRELARVQASPVTAANDPEAPKDPLRLATKPVARRCAPCERIRAKVTGLFKRRNSGDQGPGA